MRTLFALLVLTSLVGLMGCGGGGKKPDSAGPKDKDKLDDIARLVKDFEEQKKRPPASLREVADADATHPVAHAALSTGEYVLIWKAGLSSSAGNAVLAYHKDVPTKGGPVLMQDGKGREMTAEEFRSAPKAGR